jgi:hypothetical protein
MITNIMNIILLISMFFVSKLEEKCVSIITPQRFYNALSFFFRDGIIVEIKKKLK